MGSPPPALVSSVCWTRGVIRSRANVISARKTQHSVSFTKLRVPHCPNFLKYRFALTGVFIQKCRQMVGRSLQHRPVARCPGAQIRQPPGSGDPCPPVPDAGILAALPPSPAADVSVKCLPQCPGWIPLPMMAVHAEPGLLTGCERPACLDQARPNPCVWPVELTPCVCRQQLPLCPTLGALVWRQPCGACGGRHFAAGPAGTHARRCPPPAPCSCFSLVSVRLLRWARASRSGGRARPVLRSSGLYSPCSGRRGRDPVTDMPGGFIFITSSPSRRRELRLRGLNVNREQAAGQALLGPKGPGCQVPACRAQPAGDPWARGPRWGPGAAHGGTLGGQPPFMKGRARVCASMRVRAPPRECSPEQLSGGPGFLGAEGHA